MAEVPSMTLVERLRFPAIACDKDQTFFEAELILRNAAADEIERRSDWVTLAHAMFKAWGPTASDGAWFDYQAKAQLLVNVLNSPST